MNDGHSKTMLAIDDYHRPVNCPKCNGIMVFKGLGEYKCEDCKYVDYDDYGKVRLYIEKHSGATAMEVEQATGVSQKAIRQLLKEERIMVAEGSAVFLKCEICGTEIRSGRFCPKCLTNHNRRIEEEARKKKNLLQGYGTVEKGESGAKRFHWDREGK